MVRLAIVSEKLLTGSHNLDDCSTFDRSKTAVLLRSLAMKHEAELASAKRTSFWRTQPRSSPIPTLV